MLTANYGNRYQLLLQFSAAGYTSGVVSVLNFNRKISPTLLVPIFKWIGRHQLSLKGIYWIYHYAFCGFIIWLHRVSNQSLRIDSTDATTTMSRAIFIRDYAAQNGSLRLGLKRSLKLANSFRQQSHQLLISFYLATFIAVSLEYWYHR